MNSLAKRVRLSSGILKRAKTSHGSNDGTLPVTTPASESPEAPKDPNPPENNLPDAASPSEPSRPETDPWSRVMVEANNLAPRVGNTLCDPNSQIFQMAQRLVPDLCIQSMFVCRGTDRLQVPILAPTSKEFPIRRTICTHRKTSEIHDLGSEDWHNLTRNQRIRKSVPSRLTITIFGSSRTPSHEPNALPRVPESSENRAHLKISADTETPPNSSASRVSRVDQLPSECQLPRRDRPAELPLEGWAPPPVPLHGPKYRSLNSDEKRQLVQLHKNLGHPDPSVFANHLKDQGALDHIVEAARDFVCDTCVESTQTRHQRPSKLHEPKEF